MDFVRNLEECLILTFEMNTSCLDYSNQTINQLSRKTNGGAVYRLPMVLEKTSAVGSKADNKTLDGTQRLVISQ